MDKPKKKRKTAPKRKIQVTVMCLYCNQSFPKSRLEVGVVKTKICCGGLNRHLASKSRSACYDHYAKNYMKDGKFDFYPSLISQDEQLYRHLFTSNRSHAIDYFFSPSNLGLTGTNNGPIPASHPAFSSSPNLNMQTIYNANQPQISRALIVNNFPSHQNSTFNPNDDEDPPDNHFLHDDVSESVPIIAETITGDLSATTDATETTTNHNENSVCVVPDSVVLEEMNHNLSSEVELLNLCRHLRTPLHGSKLIWEWAMKCQKKRALILLVYSFAVLGIQFSKK